MSLETPTVLAIPKSPLPIDDIVARLRATTTTGVDSTTNGEIPPNWKFCSISPLYLFPYQVNDLKGFLLADAKYEEKTQRLKIENIGNFYKRERLIGFLKAIRARDKNVKISWKA